MLHSMLDLLSLVEVVVGQPLSSKIHGCGTQDRYLGSGDLGVISSQVILEAIERKMCGMKGGQDGIPVESVLKGVGQSKLT